MVETHAEDEQLVALRNWWQENGTSLVIAVVVAVVGVVGWRWYGEHKQAQSEAASAIYQQYLEARASNADVAATLAQLDTDFPKSSYRIFTLFYRAADAAKAEKYSDAAPLLETAVEIASDANLRDVARLRYAKVLAQMSEYDKALEQIASVRGEGFRSSAAELKGDILMAQGDVKGAQAAYQAAVDAAGGGDGNAAELGRQNGVLEAKLADATRTEAPATPATPATPAQPAETTTDDAP